MASSQTLQDPQGKEQLRADGAEPSRLALHSLSDRPPFCEERNRSDTRIPKVDALPGADPADFCSLPPSLSDVLDYNPHHPDCQPGLSWDNGRCISKNVQS